MKHRVPYSSVLSPLLFLVYVNDLSPTIKAHSKSVLFVEDANIIISHSEMYCFKNCVNVLLLA
jgi:hypothetical protein